MATYRDPRITADDSGVHIRSYYFPVGSKHIAWPSIRGVEKRSMTALRGRYRIWGSGDLRHYYNLDPQRPRKDIAFVLDLGRHIRPVVTPDDPDAFAAVFAEHTAG
jgi:hypothetical protein